MDKPEGERKIKIKCQTTKLDFVPYLFLYAFLSKWTISCNTKITDNIWKQVWMC